MDPVLLAKDDVSVPSPTEPVVAPNLECNNAVKAADDEGIPIPLPSPVGPAPMPEPASEPASELGRESVSLVAFEAEITITDQVS
jgi:hypothetical protein